MQIKVFADAGSNLYPSFLKQKQLDINIIPMSLLVGEENYILYDDSIDVPSFAKGVYQKMNEDIEVKTSQITPFTFEEYFKKETDQGNKIICFTMAKGISGTYNSAVTAAEKINNEVGEEVIHIVDSMTAGFGEGLQAIHAYEEIQKGRSFKQVIKEAESFKHKVRSEFTVDNISFLAKTGRVKQFVAKIADFMKIKVMLKGSEESNIVTTGKVLGRSMSLKRLAKTCIANIVNPNEQVVYISHGDCLEDAKIVEKILIESGIHTAEIYDYDVITGSHVGPGTVAIFYIGKNRD